jgi:aryl-alcohol dehydrogenase-like predicted oxidoreductase
VFDDLVALFDGLTGVARIGLGLAAVGRPGYINLGRAEDLPHSRTAQALRERSHELLDQAYAAGVRYFDVARSYGRADAIRAALEIEVDGTPLFRSVQATWNLLEPSAGPALAEAHASGRAVIVKEAMANGRLAYHPDLGAGADAVALAAALHQPWATIVLSGAATSAQLASNLRAATLTLSPADLDSLATLAEPGRRYWQTRAALPWT